jgi:hypothetical protein
MYNLFNIADESLVHLFPRAKQHPRFYGEEIPP